MNERIKELITEAWGIPAFKISDIFHWDREEKFAELIIQECLNICEEMGDNGKDGHYCADKIAKTFLR
jgi:hypothetical protein